MGIHKHIANMMDTVLYRTLEFPKNLVWTESHMCTYTFTSRENDDTPSNANITRIYGKYGVIKIKLVAECCHASPCSDLLLKKSVELTIGYICRVLYIYKSKNSAKYFLKLSAFGFRLHQSFKTQ